MILDMDGLLLDTEPVYNKAWQYAGSQLGFQLSDQLCNTFSGNSLQAIRQSMGQHFGTEFDFDTFLQMSSEHWYQMIADDGVQPMPGALRLLETLNKKQINYALATNSPAHIAEHCLQHAGLADAFPVRVTSNDVTNTKPAPDIYTLAMQKLNTPACLCLCVEDSLPGIQAAFRAGGVTALVTAPSVLDVTLADYRFCSLDELQKCL